MTLPVSVPALFEAWKQKQEKKELRIARPNPQPYQDPYIRLPYKTRFSSGNIERTYQLFDRAIANSLKNYSEGTYVILKVSHQNYWTKWYAYQCKQNGKRIPYIRITEIKPDGSCLLHALLFGDNNIDPLGNYTQKFHRTGAIIPEWRWCTNGDHPTEYLRHMLTHLSPESYCFYWVYNLKILTLSSSLRVIDFDNLEMPTKNKEDES